MELLLLIEITGVALTFLAVVVALLNWRYPRAAPPSPPVENQRDDEERRDEGLALVLGLLWMARNRRKARTQEPVDPN
jgi:membrane protein implicated in regulation of membrane protease activity